MKSDNQINFALVTSDSLMNRIPSWESYQSMDQAQYLDLIDYSKELVSSDEDHKITFLVVAEGIDQVEEEEAAIKKEAEKEAERKKEEEEEKFKQSQSLRENSKNILNSIYGR
tara:strand:+ start:544 stop:882 length:339 start_codon:yes stop_codon:yes gene_type:complete